MTTEMAAAPEWTRTPWTDAALLAKQIDPDRPTAVPDGLALHEWFGQLIAAGSWPQAAIFLAHALPRYECIVWGAQALMEMGAAERTDPVLVSVLRWIDQPSDALRRDAGDLAQSLRRDTPAKLLAMAVFYSGGSIAPAEYAAILPPGGACAMMAAAAILAGADGPDFVPRIKQALARGEAMARGA